MSDAETKSGEGKVRAEIDQRLGELQQMADEIRVKIHLAGMDAKDEWEELQPKLAQLEKQGSRILERTTAEVSDLTKDLEARFKKLKKEVGS